MSYSYLLCVKITIHINAKVEDTNKGKLMLLWTFPMWYSKKLRLIKKQEANELLSMIGTIPTLGKISIKRLYIYIYIYIYISVCNMSYIESAQWLFSSRNK